MVDGGLVVYEGRLALKSYLVSFSMQTDVNIHYAKHIQYNQ